MTHFAHTATRTIRPTVSLYRPATASQLAAIARTDWLAFGTESLVSGYFYPMLHSGYAQLIARQWHARHYGEGFVLQCRVDADWLSQFQPQTVATDQQLEYRIAASLLPDFNTALHGRIDILHHYPCATVATPRAHNTAMRAPMPAHDWPMACPA
ncbi:MAG: hypothetical protein EP312_08275 [Gammaproteobacteria bacterium]|nr:MAG: hypothetical protein EP312_08275 [Gammaproteobacteria bacterium]